MVAFDLAQLSTARHQNFRAVRRLWTVLIAVFVALVTWLTYQTASILRHGPLDPTQLLVVVVLYSGVAFAVGICAFAAWKTGPGAVGVFLDEEGIKFSWRSGRLDALQWNDLTRGMVLLDYSSNPILPNFTHDLWEIRRWNRPVSSLSRDAFDDIIRMAADHGLVVDSRDLKNPARGWGTCRAVRFAICAPAHAP